MQVKGQKWSLWTRSKRTPVWMRVEYLPHWKRDKIRLLESFSESKNDCETEIEDPEDDSTDEYPPLGM